MHFYSYKGIIKKVEQVQFFRKLSPLGNAVLFKKKKKKIALEVNRGRQVRARARPVANEAIYIFHTKNMQVRIFS